MSVVAVFFFPVSLQKDRSGGGAAHVKLLHQQKRCYKYAADFKVPEQFAVPSLKCLPLQRNLFGSQLMSYSLF